MLISMIAIAAIAVAEPADDPQAKIVEAAAEQLKAGNRDQALATIEPALVEYARRYAGEKQQIYCGYSPTETLLYLTMAAAAKRNAMAISPGWCEALFVKGYALIDAKRLEEGTRYLLQASNMAPQHAHILNELGFAYQQQRNWQLSYDTYAKAADGAAIGDKNSLVAEKSRGWRGMAYALVELGRWDEAEKLYKQSLALDPNDHISPGELRYIAEHRPKG